LARESKHAQVRELANLGRNAAELRTASRGHITVVRPQDLQMREQKHVRRKRGQWIVAEKQFLQPREVPHFGR
jgi:hypothetical protein